MCRVREVDDVADGDAEVCDHRCVQVRMEPLQDAADRMLGPVRQDLAQRAWPKGACGDCAHRGSACGPGRGDEQHLGPQAEEE
jgi:hypothetical protein